MLGKCFTAVFTLSMGLLAEAVTRPRTSAVMVAMSPAPSFHVIASIASLTERRFFYGLATDADFTQRKPR